MFFDNCKTDNDLKQRFRLLSKRFHPDVGGTDDLMKELIEEYDKKKYNINYQEPRKEPIKPERKKAKRTQSYADYESKIDSILKWAEKNDFFDTEFIESLFEQVRYKDLSFSQEQAIDNIIKKFKISL